MGIDLILPVVIAIIAIVPGTLAALYSRSTSKQVRPHNGDTFADLVYAINDRLTTHIESDRLTFATARETQQNFEKYNHDRWHKDDSRYTVLTGIISIYADPDIPVEKKSELIKHMLDRANLMIDEKWDGQERRQDDSTYNPTS